jgi:hypothetical protein
MLVHLAQAVLTVSGQRAHSMAGSAILSQCWVAAEFTYVCADIVEREGLAGHTSLQQAVCQERLVQHDGARH